MQNINSEKPEFGRSALIQKLRGLLLPTPTPYAANDAVDPAAWRANLEKWSQTGIAGFVVLGSTGERVNLNEREYDEALAAVRPSTDLLFIAGAGQESTRGSIEEVKRAAHLGAEAVLVITPHFYRSSVTQDALIAHYSAIADSSPVPVLLYSMPALTGIKIEPETIAELSEHQNIIGVKDSSADIDGLKRTVELVRKGAINSLADTLASGTSLKRDDFVVLTGNGTVLYDALRVGADGAILAVGCVVPELCLQIFHAVQSGNHEHAAGLQQVLTPLAQAVTTRFGIGGLKAAMDMIGLAGGRVRAPLQSPAESARDEIAQLLSQAQAALNSNAVAGAMTTGLQ